MNNQQFKFVSKRMQEFLTKQGYKIDVTHGRPCNGFGIVDPTTRQIDTVLSKLEFSHAVYGHPDKEQEVFAATDSENYGDFVDSSGGFTKVDILTPEGKVLSGKYSFKNDKFVKSKGVSEAIRAALKGTKTLSGFNKYLKETVETVS